MADQPMARRDYMVWVYNDPEVEGDLRFTFMPATDRTVRSEKKPPAQSAEYIVSVHGNGADAVFHWIKVPEDKATQHDLEDRIRFRTSLRFEWLEKLRKLIADVKHWAEELDWSTRIIDKRIDDAEIGAYRAPALLLQKETVRLLLEPIARKAPGADGVVDLCLMPSYDDIASFYYYNDQWHIHYGFKEKNETQDFVADEAWPLSKSAMERVFNEMMTHAR